MDTLETLNALLDMTREAEELVSDVEKSEHLRLLVVEMRSKAKEERRRLRRDPNQTVISQFESSCSFFTFRRLAFGEGVL